MTATLACHDRIAGEFDALWGCELHFAGDGAVDFIRTTITHPDNAHYILRLAKGTGVKGPNEPADVHRPVPDEEMHVPLDQLIYVGDGASDLPVFHLLNRHGGFALAVYKSEKARDWDNFSPVRPAQRVENLAPADFREGSELLRSLLLAVESIAKRVALRCLSVGE